MTLNPHLSQNTINMTHLKKGSSRMMGFSRSAHRGWKSTGERLEGDVVHDLVVAALQKGGVDGAEGRQALARQAGRKRHGMLSRDRRRSKPTTSDKA